MKKFIAALLSAAMLASCLASYAVAADAPKDKEPLLEALGIVDNGISQKIAENAPLTRADAAYYALKVTGKMDIPDYKDDIFSDVTSNVENGAAINYCAELGLVSVGDNFRPGEAVTEAEFFKMILSSLGCDKIAELFGGWPSGYMNISRTLELDGGLSGIGENSPLGYKHLETVLMNTLMSPVLEIKMDSGKTKIEKSDDKNVLYKIFNVYKVRGTVTANAVTSLKAPVGIGDECVRIEDTVFKVSDSLYPEISKQLGSEINAWVKEDDYEDYIICYENRRKDDIEVIDADDFDRIENGVLIYTNSSRTKTVNIPADCAVIYNGRAIEKEISSDVFDKRWGNIRLIRNASSKLSAVIITAYDNYYVGRIDKDNFTCYDNTVDNRKISFEDNGKISKYAYFTNNSGERLSFDDISTDCVLSVAQNGDYYECIIVKESVTGAVKQITTGGDGETKVYVDNNTYRFAREMDSSRAMDIKSGSTYVFFLDGSGKISAVKPEHLKDESLSWVYLLGIYDDDSGDNAYIRVLTPSDDRNSLKISNRVKIDGKTVKNITSAILTEKFKLANPSGIEQPIKILVNAEGEVTDIDTVYLSDSENEGSSIRRFYNGEDGALYFKRNLSAFGMKVQYSANTVVFSVPQTGNSYDYTAISPDVFMVDVQYNIAAYNTNKHSRVADVIVCTDAIAAAKRMWMQDYLTVVTDVSTAADDDGEILTRLRGYQNGIENEWFLENDSVLKIDTDNGSMSSENGKIKVEKGDAIRFSTEKTGKIDNIQLIFDCSERKYHHPIVIAADSLRDGIAGIGGTYQRMQIGLTVPYSISNSSLMSAVNMNEEPDSANQEYIVNQINMYKVYVVEVGSRGTEVRTGSTEDIKDWYNYGADGNTDYLMRCRYDEGKDIIVYRY